MKTIIVTITYFLFIVVDLTQVSYAQSNEVLKHTIDSLLTEQRLSGAVWAVVSDKGEITTGAAGFKNYKTKELLDPKNKVHVGSVSKAILAAGFLRMATVGLVKLDDSVKKYLPAIPLHNQWNKTNPVTIRHLLDHTSGLTDAKLWHIFSTTATPNTPLETVYLNSPNILRIQSRPGTMYSYSNIGYTILGIILEKITNTRYESYLDESVLKPLGMTNSSFQFITQAGSYADNQLAYGHFDNGEPVVAIPMYLRPAGQLTTTAGDVGKWLRFMMSDGKINDTQFISSEYLKTVGKQTMTDAYKNGVPVGDALGAYARDRYGVVGIAKNGNILGFSAMVYLFPNQQKSFFIAHNMDSETANYELFNEALIKHLRLNTRNFISTVRTTEKEIADWNGYYIPAITKVEPFRLLDYVFSHTKVETFKTSTLLSPFQGKTKELIYIGRNMFSMKDRTTTSHSFYKSDEGELFITDGVKTIKKVHGLKIAGIATSLILGVVGLIYLLATGSVYFIKQKRKFLLQPLWWIWIAIITLITSFILIANQPFMRLGDKTIGNRLLALSSLLLPLFSIISLLLIIKTKKRYAFTLSFWATIFVIQFCALLITNKLMPMMMWK